MVGSMTYQHCNWGWYQVLVLVLVYLEYLALPDELLVLLVASSTGTRYWYLTVVLGPRPYQYLTMVGPMTYQHCYWGLVPGTGTSLFGV